MKALVWDEAAAPLGFDTMSRREGPSLYLRSKGKKITKDKKTGSGGQEHQGKMGNGWKGGVEKKKKEKEGEKKHCFPFLSV